MLEASPKIYCVWLRTHYHERCPSRRHNQHQPAGRLHKTHVLIILLSVTYGSTRFVYFLLRNTFSELIS
jgi:hypothetical protein